MVVAVRKREKPRRVQSIIYYQHLPALDWTLRLASFFHFETDCWMTMDMVQPLAPIARIFTTTAVHR